jgi:hypothetical protein
MDGNAGGPQHAEAFFIRIYRVHRFGRAGYIRVGAAGRTARKPGASADAWLRSQPRRGQHKCRDDADALKGLDAKEGKDVCTVTRLYFLEVVKARAVTALCKSGPERERELGRFDADVEHLNEAIAARCS